jgi:hypothetical protein
MDKLRGWPSMFSRDQRIGIMKVVRRERMSSGIYPSLILSRGDTPMFDERGARIEE